MARAWYLIIYDVKNTARLQKLHRFMRTRGYALQKSVFAWRGTPDQLVELQQQICQRIRGSEDDVRGYRIPSARMIELWGVHPFYAGVFDARYPPISHRTLPAEFPIASLPQSTRLGSTRPVEKGHDGQERSDVG